MRNLLPLFFLMTALSAADPKVTEAAITARPNDYTAWADHAGALIEAGGAQTGDQQKSTFKIALQCAERSQALCIQNSKDMSVIIHRGDHISLGVLGMALALNDRTKEAIDTMNKAIASISSKSPQSISDMQTKMNMEAFRDKVIQSSVDDKANKAGAKAEKEVMPLVVWREAALGSTKVAKIGNPYAMPLMLTVTHLRKDATLKIARLDLAAQENREVGHMEGFSFKTGDTLLVQRTDGPKRLVVSVP